MASWAQLFRHQLVKLDILKQALVIVIREQDVAFDFSAETFHVFEFTLRNGRFDFITAQLIFEHLRAV